LARTLTAVVTVTPREASGPVVDRERPVRTLGDLYAACREAPPSDLVKVTLRGPAGDVILNFASFIRR
jgi:hypothetical protein